MNIGIIGAGNMGRTLARLFLDADHDVMLANSRGPDSLAGLVEELGDGASAGTVEEVVEFSSVVFLATRWADIPTAVAGINDWNGKIVVDTTNNYDVSGTVLDTGGRGSTELISAFLPGARIVKSFNHGEIDRLPEHFGAAADPDNPTAILVAGDNEEAKEIVSMLIGDIGGAAVDTGTLTDGDRLHGIGGPLVGLRPIGETLALLAEHSTGPGSAS